MKPKPLETRLMEKCIPVPECGCWLWIGCLEPSGGRINAGGRGQGLLLAHRASYEVFKDPIPEGKNVVHKCHTISCVNPDHLRLEILPHVVRFMGENNKSHKLTTKQVRYIRKSPASSHLLARQLKVDDHTINAIRRRDSWKHVK